MTRRHDRHLLAAAVLGFFSAGLWAGQPGGAQPVEQPPARTIITNARVFDGRSDGLTGPMNVLVTGNTITSLSAEPITGESAAGATVINAGGRTLMPGLIDAHTHIMYATLPLSQVLTSDIGFINVVAVRSANDVLMRGFTSIRDVGGPVMGLKKGIDTGVVPGPRIWPSGATISQSGGHGDFRLPNEIPSPPGATSFGERINAAMIADGPDAVRQRVREQLALGATHVKLMAGGGVSSSFDPLDVTQYGADELRAAVEAAENWGTYVTVHAYTPHAAKRAIEAGVKCIEHGQLLDDDTARLMAEKGVWWCLQPFLDDEDAIPFRPGSVLRAKQLEMVAGTDKAYGLAKKHKVKTAWGTDTLFDPELARKQGKQLAKLVRWYTPAQVLRMGTSVNGELLGLSGPRNPYPGKIGVVEKGALADLLIVDGDPLSDINLIADPAKNFVVIMKDGVVYKNTIK